MTMMNCRRFHDYLPRAPWERAGNGSGRMKRHPGSLSAGPFPGLADGQG